jgi:hypothetical protein
MNLYAATPKSRFMGLAMSKAAEEKKAKKEARKALQAPPADAAPSKPAPAKKK